MLAIAICNHHCSNGKSQKPRNRRTSNRIVAMHSYLGDCEGERNVQVNELPKPTDYNIDSAEYML